MRDPDYGWATEMQVNAARAGIPSAEAPVSGHAGPPGRSGTLAEALLTGAKIRVAIPLPAGRAPEAG